MILTILSPNFCLRREYINNIEYFKPTLKDINDMQKLVKPYIEDGTILHRSNDEIATTIRSYTSVKIDNILCGFVALHIHSQELAEIRSLIVDKTNRNHGIGTTLVNMCLKEAKQYNVKKVLTLTYKEQFFLNLNFDIIQKETIPEHKIWADCIKCKHFPICNEIALIKKV